MYRPGTCIHCRNQLKGDTKDHVFPKSWYPDTTPETVQRWTAPSCSTCNGKFGNLERELFNRLILCVDPRITEASGLSTKALRAIGVGVVDLPANEAKHRTRQKKKIIDSIGPYDPSVQTLPGLGPPAGFAVNELKRIAIPAELLIPVSEKVIRGCEYALANRIIEAPYTVGIYFVDESDVPPLFAEALKNDSGRTSHLGPGFKITRLTAGDDPNTVFYKLAIWRAITIYAAILAGEPTEDMHRQLPTQQ